MKHTIALIRSIIVKDINNNPFPSVYHRLKIREALESIKD
jgi:hypothetical protein